ncbi:Cyclopropane mycolic acid synthase MmaA2 [Mycobacterium kansasii]|uniref:SAM-dependent methyltransferase n=1 Tax=Mycobacterium kansasii TaxID=1768 RepID=UPI000F0301E2|nr:class I SAM-dependent methyltransferase [Mycobacterium kansasii]VAZ64854.1 Cyclopropane mycolic acid synthase MmaA2 [Mycobacterium kansasii]
MDVIDQAAAIRPELPPYKFKSLRNQNRILIRVFHLIAETATRLSRRQTDEYLHAPGAKAYELLLDPFRKITGLPDYTEGIYLNNSATYTDAQAAQINLLIQATGAREGDRILDVGCGHGTLLERCRELGIVASGVTVSRPQAIDCQRRGLDVRLASVDELSYTFRQNEFDAIVMNGSTEHFAAAADALVGAEHNVWRRMFASCASVLQEGGRLVVTSLHCRQRQNPCQVIKHPMALPSQSDEFYWSILNRFYSGWYPTGDDYVLAARDSNLQLVREWEMTAHYLRTSIDWGLLNSAAERAHRKEVLALYKNLATRDPRYFFISMLYELYDPWRWQLLGGAASPAIHKWQLYQLRGR